MFTEKIYRGFRQILLSLLLVLGMLVGQIPGLAVQAYADGWTDWAALIAASGWEDTEEYDADEDADKDAEKTADEKADKASDEDALEIEEDGCYTSKEEVAAYIHEYEHLPDNYITKKKAQKLGWVSSEGNLDKVAPGKSIGGDYFGNYEELLPVKKGRTYYECDIDYEGGYRDSKRIIFSDDGLIYYTEDHYKTFEQLY